MINTRKLNTDSFIEDYYLIHYPNSDFADSSDNLMCLFPLLHPCFLSLSNLRLIMEMYKPEMEIQQCIYYLVVDDSMDIMVRKSGSES